MTDEPPRARIIIIEVRESEINLADVIRELSINGPSQIFHGKVDHVGEARYEVSGQAGYVGPKGVSKENTFIQGAPQNTEPLDLAKLAEQLAAVRSAMKKAAPESTLEQDDQIGHIAQAQLAAQEGDEAGALAHLKRAGTWALAVAKQIGMEIAALTIAHAMGA